MFEMDSTDNKSDNSDTNNNKMSQKQIKFMINKFR